MSMAIFMGAGASRPFGFPLTNDILPRIREGIASGRLFQQFYAGERDAAELDEYLRLLMPGFGQNDIVLPPITDVLSLIDYSLLVSINPLRSRMAQELVRFRRLLEKAIYDVLRPPYQPTAAPEPLIRFAGRLRELAAATAGGLGVISTNYDTAVEVELFKTYAGDLAGGFDFGFGWRNPMGGELCDRPTTPVFRYYKLHGSVNWLRCELCEHIYINPRGAIGALGFNDEQSPGNTCHCDHWPLRPVLVAPSLIRDVRDVNLLEIWKHALELLRTAEQWVIIGYSFLPEDIAIRSLLIRAWQGRTERPRIVVVQQGDDPATRSRYRVFFPECDYFTGGLEAYLEKL